MKKLILSLAILFAATTTFTSCKEDTPLLSPLNGYWQCVGITGNAGGLIETPAFGADFLRFFSISYAGLGNVGTYARIGADSSTLGELQGIFGADNFDASVWTNLLSAGTFTTSGTSTTGTVIHTPAIGGGTAISYGYRIENDERRLVIIEVIASAGANANAALNLVNLIFGTNVNANVTIEYHYERVNSIADLFPGRN
jgi:hypothetical protein